MSKKSDIRSAPEGVLKVIPLGGLGEIGKNMTVFEYGEDIIVVDMGSMFPHDDMPGVDLVIPDIAYLRENAGRIRGYFVTHGHEDHIGAAPYVLRYAPAPVYATRLTCALMNLKFKEHRMANSVEMVEVEPGDTIVAGCFGVEFINVSHSIAGSCALAIHTPVGVVVHTGDFKIDYTPVAGQTTDFQRLAALGAGGVRLLLADSTNVERPGYTMSERKVGETFGQVFEKAEGRIIIAMFASNVHRIQMVADAAVRHKRHLCLLGRSMLSVAKVSMLLGYLNIPEGLLVDVDSLDRYRDDELVVLTTGSQGEPMSGLSRMAFSEHKKLEIRPSDMVIISATPIPGNELSVSKVINKLVSTGADVIYEALAEVHVSGHARQEELKLMHSLTRPQFFVPVHGEYRHLYHHARLAESLGMPEENVLIPQTGGVIELTENSIRRAGTVPSGDLLVDGLGIGDVGESVLKDRKHLSEDGMLIVVLCFDHETGELISGPDIISRGFVYVKENEELMEGAKEAVRKLLHARSYEYLSTSALKEGVREALKRYIYETTHRDPMILTIIA
ncbi:MAG: ribonuclease J [Clostridia bacterium]|nr:ribonuclease J [Clostridia bacterium]MBR5752006.1 ribonuclease J [Clostridia bacterium]